MEVATTVALTVVRIEITMVTPTVALTTMVEVAVDGDVFSERPTVMVLDVIVVKDLLDQDVVGVIV